MLEILSVTVIAACLAWLMHQGTPAMKGKRGEARVAKRLQKKLPPQTTHIVHDVTLPVKDSTTQIDHIVLSPAGIFVIETKNMSGWLFGHAEDRHWTRTHRRKKTRFQNPIMQNKKHVKAIRDLLDIPADQIRNLVVFTGSAQAKTPMPDTVFWGSRALTTHIAACETSHLTQDQLTDFAAIISQTALPRGRQTNRIHIANLRRAKP